MMNAIHLDACVHPSRPLMILGSCIVVNGVSVVFVVTNIVVVAVVVACNVVVVVQILV